MSIKYDAGEIRALYAKGQNITQWIREREDSPENSLTSILYSYDMQAGSYVQALENPAFLEHKRNFGRKLAAVLDELNPASLLDAGIGEATSLVPVLDAMTVKPERVFGFDLSLSRLLHADRFLRGHGYDNATLFTSSLDCVALPDSSVDVVVTVHAVEPNHGREDVILAELLRVARCHLVLVEPSYELGAAATKTRIEQHGYVRDLPGALARLGYKPSRWEKWGLDFNPANEAGLIVVAKPAAAPAGEGFISPVSKKPLQRRSDCWFCPEDGHAFPVINGIPCLTTENAILASKLDQF